jgi:Golgi-body localisation protein domain
VGGITIYENFELSFHPLRLQIDARVGRRIMQYLFPDRKARQVQEASEPTKTPVRASADSPRTAQPGEGLSLPAPRRLATSRSFSDLRGAREHSLLTAPAFLSKNRSTDSLNNLSTPNSTTQSEQEVRDSSEAAVMKNRSSQKSFVFVRISRYVFLHTFHHVHLLT